MNEEDLRQIRFMMQSAQAALVFSEGKTQEKLFSDTRLLFALVKALDLIGGSGAKVSAEGRIATSQLDWNYLLDLPNRIYHNDDVNLSEVWDAVTNTVPPLVAQLQHILLIHENRA